MEILRLFAMGWNILEKAVTTRMDIFLESLAPKKGTDEINNCNNWQFLIESFFI